MAQAKEILIPTPTVKKGIPVCREAAPITEVSEEKRLMWVNRCKRQKIKPGSAISDARLY